MFVTMSIVKGVTKTYTYANFHTLCFFQQCACPSGRYRTGLCLCIFLYSTDVTQN